MRPSPRGDGAPAAQKRLDQSRRIKGAQGRDSDHHQGAGALCRQWPVVQSTLDVEYLVEHLVVDLRARISLPIATAAVRLVPATRLAITLIAPLRDEHAAAAWAFAAAVLWAGLAHVWLHAIEGKKPRPRAR